MRIMKRIFLILLSAFVTLSAYSQMSSQVNYSSLEKKIDKSNSDIEHAKKSTKYKTWLKRGELMLEVYDAMTLSANTGMTINEFELVVGVPKEKKEIDIDGERATKFLMERTDFVFVNQTLAYWMYTNSLVDNPLHLAYNSFKKVKELDEKGKSEKALKGNLETLKYNFITEGSVEYAKKNYSKSYDYFVKAIEIGEMPLVNYVDTVMIYYAGLSAQLNDDYESAIKLYDKSIEYESYMDGNVYYNAFDAYNAMEKSDQGLSYLEQGFVKFPQNQNILYGLIDYYLKRGENPETVIEYIDKALETGENYSLYFAKGTLFDNLGNLEEAVKSYKKSIDLKPDYFDAVFNLAALYFNHGVKYLEEANKVPAREVEKYDALIEKSNAEFRKSIPYMERALEIQPDNLPTLESLRNLYFRYRNDSDEMMKKYEEVNARWDELKE